MKKLKGFTLMELIVVIAIIGVLSALLIPSWMYYIAKSHIKSENDNAHIIFNSAQNVVQNYEFKERKIPAASQTISNGDFYFYWNGKSGTECDAAGASVAQLDPNFNSNFANEVNKIFSGADQTVYKVYVSNYIVQSVAAGRRDEDLYMGSYPHKQTDKNTSYDSILSYNMNTIK